MTKSTHEGLTDALAPEVHLMLTHTQRETLLRIMDQDVAFLEKVANLIVDPESGKITGLIDWEMVGI